jgi:hyperosmotically inducible protein
MTRTTRWMTCAALLMSAAALPPLQAQDRAKDVRQEIRHELLQLPYYSVFDFIAFKYDKGTAVLMGYAYAPSLKHDAEHAVKRVAGVDTVDNRIEQLPPSQQDDDIRWKVYYAIYTDPFLSKYAPGGALLWGHRHRFGGFDGLWEGMEPAGDYPIHIIVRGGRVTLMGVVDDQGDKTIAEMKARQVPGSFEVKNDLIVERSGKRGA